MYYGLKQGQITPNIENKYVLKFIYSVVHCSKITNTVLFLKRILHHFPAFLLLSTSNVRMSEGTFCRVEVHIYISQVLFSLFFSYSYEMESSARIHYLSRLMRKKQSA